MHCADQDVDGDGYFDSKQDSDNDGVLNKWDTDDDNDGLPGPHQPSPAQCRHLSPAPPSTEPS